MRLPVPPETADVKGLVIAPPTQTSCVLVGWMDMVGSAITVTGAGAEEMLEQPPEGNDI